MGETTDEQAERRPGDPQITGGGGHEPDPSQSATTGAGSGAPAPAGGPAHDLKSSELPEPKSDPGT